MSIRATRGIAVVVLCASWACAKKDTAADSAAVADSASKAAAASTPAAAPAPAPAALNDANIAALLDEANAGDSTMGNLASTKGKNASVKGFGRDMMRDHHALRKAGQDLAKKLNLTPAPPAGDTLPAAAQRSMDSMNSMAAGPDWDKAYINNEVAVHQSVLSLLQAASGAASDTSLKALIAKATPNIEAHLKKAQDIQTKLNNAPAADSSKKK
jgi:putative membrane protein